MQPSVGARRACREHSDRAASEADSVFYDVLSKQRSVHCKSLEKKSKISDRVKNRISYICKAHLREKQSNSALKKASASFGEISF